MLHINSATTMCANYQFMNTHYRVWFAMPQNTPSLGPSRELFICRFRWVLNRATFNISLNALKKQVGEIVPF